MRLAPGSRFKGADGFFWQPGALGKRRLGPEAALAEAAQHPTHGVNRSAITGVGARLAHRCSRWQGHGELRSNPSILALPSRLWGKREGKCGGNVMGSPAFRPQTERQMPWQV